MSLIEVEVIRRKLAIIAENLNAWVKKLELEEIYKEVNG